MATTTKEKLYNHDEGIARLVLHSSPRGAEDPNDVVWIEHDTQGYLDGGPCCDTCGACDEDDTGCEEEHCAGLSSGFGCQDGGDFLCTACFDEEYEVVKVSK